MANPSEEQFEADPAVPNQPPDRDPKNPTLGRAVVYSAVDPQLGAMTTRLAGANSLFLPFNRGRGGGTKGNRWSS